jgi:hypothetical protein
VMREKAPRLEVLDSIVVFCDFSFKMIASGQMETRENR